MANLTLRSEELRAFPPLVQDFVAYKQVIMGNSPKTVCEYLLDLRTFFRYLEAVRLGIDPEDPDFEGEIFLLRAAECSEDEAYEEYEIVTDENEMNAVLVLMQDDLEELGITVEE